jgi:hypothetical protein
MSEKSQKETRRNLSKASSGLNVALARRPCRSAWFYLIWAFCLYLFIVLVTVRRQKYCNEEKRKKQEKESRVYCETQEGRGTTGKVGIERQEAVLLSSWSVQV